MIKIGLIGAGWMGRAHAAAFENAARTAFSEALFQAGLTALDNAAPAAITARWAEDS